MVFIKSTIIEGGCFQASPFAVSKLHHHEMVHHKIFNLYPVNIVLFMWVFQHILVGFILVAIWVCGCQVLPPIHENEFHIYKLSIYIYIYMICNFVFDCFLGRLLDA